MELLRLARSVELNAFLALLLFVMLLSVQACVLALSLRARADPSALARQVD